MAAMKKHRKASVNINIPLDYFASPHSQNYLELNFIISTHIYHYYIIFICYIHISIRIVTHIDEKNKQNNESISRY